MSTRDARAPASAALVLAAAGALLLAGRAWIGVKAAVASVLIDRAWSAHLADGRAHPPWPWADMHPVARLELPRLGVRRTILSGASGQSLAFGLAAIDGFRDPDARAPVAVAGHRDTWAAFMRDVRTGDEVRVVTRGSVRSYVVDDIVVVDRGRGDLVDDRDDDRLTMVTCWPFAGIVRSPWRAVIIAHPSGHTDPRAMMPVRALTQR